MSNYEIIKEVLPIILGITMVGSYLCYSAKWQAVRVAGVILHLTLLGAVVANLVVNWSFYSGLPLEVKLILPIFPLLILLIPLVGIKKKTEA